jgi:hypothetical protein
MKKLIIVLLGILVIGNVLTGCGEGQVSSGLGDKFSLKVGETSKIASENLTLKFEKVLNDSRCPDGAMCIWEGQVQSLVTIELNGKNEQITLTQLGSTDTTTQLYDGYKIAFYVTPYPKVNQTISNSDYRLNLTVTKSS